MLVPPPDPRDPAPELSAPYPEAMTSAPPSPRGRFRLWHFVVLGLLLIAPGLALQRLSTHIHFQWLLAYAGGISLLTYALYGADKDSAADRRSTWRASETLMHAFELAGGWPGAFLAQRRLRHKSAKISYQVIFWLIVALHVFVATDYVLHWRLTLELWHHLFHSGTAPVAGE